MPRPFAAPRRRHSPVRSLLGLLVALTVLLGAVPPHAPEAEAAGTQFARRFGAASQTAITTAVVMDESGASYAAGTFAGTVNFGGGPLTSAGNTDVWIMKLDPRGNHVWSRRFGGTSQEQVSSLVFRNGVLRLGGGFGATIDFGTGPLASAGSTDGYVATLNASDGATTGAIRFGGTGFDVVADLAVAPGFVFVVGRFDGTVNFGGGPLASAGFSDAFVVRLDESLAHLSSKRFGSTGADAATAVVVGEVAVNSSDLFVAGQFSGSVDFGGGPLVSAGSTDAFVTRMNFAGTHAWSGRLGGPQGDSATVLVAESTGLWVGGEFQATADFDPGAGTANRTSNGLRDNYVTKLRLGDGGLLSTLAFGTPDEDFIRGLATDGRSIIAAGQFRGPLTLGTFPLPSTGSATFFDAFVVRLALDGTSVMDARGFAGTGQDLPQSLAAAPGVIVAGGLFSGTTDFGNGPIGASSNGEDAFVVRLDPIPLPTRRPVTFDGGTRADIGIFRPPSSLHHAIITTGSQVQPFVGVNGLGQPGDLAAPGDYNGDGRADFAIFTPATGFWFGVDSGGNQVLQIFPFGTPGDIPVPADYDGDGRTDAGFFRPSTGFWFGASAPGGQNVVMALNGFGQGGDVPVVADYDGDGRADPAIYRPSNGLWFGVDRFGQGIVLNLPNFGLRTDEPIPADYDGDGRADPAIFRRSNGLWFGLKRDQSAVVLNLPGFGQTGDVPVPGDFDGDGRADPAIYRSSNGLWFGLKRDQSAVVLNVGGLGQVGDQPF